MAQRIFSILYFLFLAFPSFAQAGNAPPSSADTVGPQFYFINNDRAHDFGAIELNATVTYKFEFKNSGSQPLVIKEMHCSPKGINSPPYKIILSYTQSSVRPGQTGIIEVTFRSQGDVGSFKNIVYVTSNVTGANYPLLFITGAIIPVQGKQEPPVTETTIPDEFLHPLIKVNINLHKSQ
jgi:hypothetical protein